MGLIEDLEAATQSAQGAYACNACAAIKAAGSGPAGDALAEALAGTIGTRTLSHILRKHDIKVGRDAITKHRTEGHHDPR